MKRKLVALVLAIMLVGSCVGAFATTEGRYNNQDIAIINAALAQYYPQEQEMVGYVIKDGGLWMLLSTTTYTLNDTVVSGNAAADLYKYYEDNPTQANMQAYLASVVEKTTSTTPTLVEVDADYVTGKDLDAVKAEHPGYTEVAGFEDESYWLLSNGTNFIIVAKNASTEVEGMGFAIPISSAKDILDNLMTKQTRIAVGEDAQGYLGIRVTNIDSATSKAYGMPIGVYVYQIMPEGAAANSDLKEKDIITKFDGQSITTAEELTDMLTYYEKGSQVTLTVQTLTNGAYVEHDVTVTLGDKLEDNTNS